MAGADTGPVSIEDVMSRQAARRSALEAQGYTQRIGQPGTPTREVGGRRTDRTRRTAARGPERGTRGCAALQTMTDDEGLSFRESPFRPTPESSGANEDPSREMVE